jgi:hypothetical protein
MDHKGFDRRRMITGMGMAIGAAGAGALAVPGLASAAAPPPPPDPNSNTANPGGVGAQPLAFAATPGLMYAGISGYNLMAYQLAGEYMFDLGGVGVGPRPNGTSVVCDIELPHGARIREIQVTGSGSTNATLQRQPYGAYSWSTIGSCTTASGSGLQTGKTSGLSHVVDRTTGTYLIFAFLNNTQAISSVAVGYDMAPTGFVPISPVRAYDSRWTASGSTAGLTLGVISGGSSRTVSVADGRDLNTGAITSPNAVPAGASAIAYNLTLSNTTGIGFLAVTPGNASTYAASSINWSEAGQLLANGLIVGVDGTRAIKVFAGGSSTNFIVDVVGYFI